MMQRRGARRGMTIKQVLLIWAVTGIVSAILLGWAGVVSNNLLSSNQNRLVDTVLPLENALRNISAVITELIERQNIILTAEESQELASLPPRDSLDKQYQAERDKLTRLQAVVTDYQARLEALDRKYRSFIDTDTRLLETTKTILTLQQRLEEHGKQIDAVGQNIQNLADSIFGKVRLESQRIRRKIRKALQDPQQATQLPSLVAAVITGTRGNIQQASSDIKTGVVQLSILSRQMMLESNTDVLTSIKETQVVEVIGLINGALETMHKNVEASSELLALAEQLRKDIDTLVVLLVDGKQSAFALRTQRLAKEETLDTLVKVIRTAVSSLTASLDEFSALMNVQMQAAVGRSYTVITTSRLVVVVVGIVVVLIVIGMVLYSNASIVRPIRETSSALQDISAGEGDLTRRLNDTRVGEIGELAHGFNTFIEQLHGIMTQVAETTTHMHGSADEILTAVTEQAGIVAQQSSSITEITATMEELSSTAKYIAEQSQSVADTSTQALHATENGAEAVQSVMQTMDNINQTYQQGIHEIVELGKRSKEITKIMEIINNIADQTKLIAFNAALEAASAGEAGKRFGVVAAEIRRLADNVMEFTGEIETQLNEIQEAIDRLVIASEQSTKVVQEGMASSAQTVVLLDDILAGAQSTSDAATQISLSTQQQTTASDQVVVALQEISEGSKQTSASINQINTISKEFAELSSNLQELIGKFKLER